MKKLYECKPINATSTLMPEKSGLFPNINQKKQQIMNI
jgi:hypothetical protein